MPQRRPSSSPPPSPSPPPVCEGWLEKYALGRSFFSSHGWNRRYAFASHEGLALSKSNPREKGNGAAALPWNAMRTKTFIPFERRRRGETEMQPVYIIDDLSAARHPEVPQKSHNGICSDSVSSMERFSSKASAKDGTSTGSASSPELSIPYYYFGLTFEEHRKRYLLLFRTSSPKDYIMWTTYLPLYVHEGSASRIVPLGHPLEAGRPQPVDVNYRRLTEKREVVLPCSITYHADPDPCLKDEYMKIRLRCIGWDEGEQARLFARARRRMHILCGPSAYAALESIAEIQEQSEDDHRHAVFKQFEELSPTFPDYEARCSVCTNSSEEEGESGDVAAAPALTTITHSGTAQAATKQLVGIDKTTDYSSVHTSSEPHLAHPNRFDRPARVGGTITRKSTRIDKVNTFSFTHLADTRRIPR